MAKYFLTNKAVEDLSKIWNYTYEVWSEDQADKYYELLTGFCKEISKNPSLGKNYNEIEVLRFLHSKMDIKNRIQE